MKGIIISKIRSMALLILISSVVSVSVYKIRGKGEGKYSSGVVENYQSTTDNQENQWITVMEDVNVQMLCADYWIEKCSNPHEILMSPAEIQEWNEIQIEDKRNDVNSINYYNIQGKEYVSKEQLKTAIGGVTSTELSSQGAFVSINKKLYDAKGVEIPSSHWASAIDNCNYDGINDKNKISYGVITRYTEMRALPTSERGYQDKTVPFYDNFINSTALVNEPVIILHTSKDGKWKCIFSSSSSGWVLSKDVAVCSSYDQWKESQKGDFLLVTQDRFRLEDDVTKDRPELGNDEIQEEINGLELSMGTKLKLVKSGELSQGINGRKAQNVYTVKIPVSDKNGMLTYICSYIPVSKEVQVGYMNYTTANVLKLAFKTLGDLYGWGGMYNSRDCSSLMADIYKCFGFQLGRNSGEQAALKCVTFNMEGLSDEEKISILDKNVLPGSILYFSGHVFMYLGQDNGKAYSISATGSIKGIDADGEDIFVQSVMVNSLNIYRTNKKTWLESLSVCKEILLP
ncbi:MAG: NlpC/P60 family protein [Eubacteriales bacterium]|nr:NlpC/P60 family protein [Eubacteriales bacterium]